MSKGHKMARGMFAGLAAGGLASVVGLSGLSLLGETPAGNTPPRPPLVQAPDTADVPAPVPAPGDETTSQGTAGVNTPVGSLVITAPIAPDLPEGEAAIETVVPLQSTSDVSAPRADTDPLDEPVVASIEGTMAAPSAPEGVDVVGQPVDPVLPNPQSMAPQVPESETDLTISTAPAAPNVVVVPDEEPVVVVEDPVADPAEELVEGTEEVATAAPAAQEVIVIEAETPDTPVVLPTDIAEDTTLVAPAAPRIALQGGDNMEVTELPSGVTIRRPATSTPQPAAPEEAAEAEEIDALIKYAGAVENTDGAPMMSIVLIDDGTMSAAAAALSGLSFPVTLAVDPLADGAAELVAKYRADGFEVALMPRLPEGATPQDVSVTFESVFSSLPETIGVLDMGTSGLQADREVTAQAMDILAADGRGYITISQGLNTAARAAQTAGVPSVVVFRDLDKDGQEARVIRRFVDQAAFRARQESGVVLIGRVRPDTISALILWGTANQDGQVAIVPVSAILRDQ